MEDYYFVLSISQATNDVIAERKRQIEVEGWTQAHDDRYRAGVLSTAGAAYAIHGNPFRPGLSKALWPFDKKWWKPRGDRANLVRAAALIIAEIERMDRASA